MVSNISLFSFTRVHVHISTMQIVADNEGLFGLVEVEADNKGTYCVDLQY